MKHLHLHLHGDPNANYLRRYVDFGSDPLVTSPRIPHNKRNYYSE